MFDRVKAISIYRDLLSDLNEAKELLENRDDYDGIDRGFTIIRKSSVKLLDYLEFFAAADNYNFRSADVLKANGEEAVLLSIDNEKKNRGKGKILKLDDYRKK